MTNKPATMKALKDMVWQRLEATNTRKEMVEKSRKFEKLYLDWENRGLILNDDKVEVTQEHRKEVADFEKQELMAKKADWEKAGSH